MKKRKKQNDSLDDLLDGVIRFAVSNTKAALSLVFIAVVVVAIAGGVLWWLSKSNHLGLGQKEEVTLTPAQIQSIVDIGQWEFLTINVEEVADTTRHGFFSDDELVRIYKGTLRLGIDMKNAAEEWVSMDGDTVVMSLPAIQLLDEHILDEAASKAFYEKGTWNQQARAELAEKARQAMIRRGLTRENMAAAEEQAKDHFRRMALAMGIDYVRVEFPETAE